MGFKNSYKYFLNFLIGLAFIILNIINQYAHAKNLSDLSQLNKNSADAKIAKNLSFGAEGIYMFAGIRDDWQSILRKTHPGANLYVGYNWPYIMLEMGYSWTTRRAQDSFVNTGDQLFGISNDNPTTISGQVRFRSTHFDFNFFANVYEDFDIVTSIGASFARPHVTVHISNSSSTLGTKLTEIVGKTTLVPRIGLGFRYLFSDTFGVRSMWHFDKNSRIKLRYVAVPSDQPFRDANTLSFGFFSRL